MNYLLLLTFDFLGKLFLLPQISRMPVRFFAHPLTPDELNLTGFVSKTVFRTCYIHFLTEGADCSNGSVDFLTVNVNFRDVGADFFTVRGNFSTVSCHCFSVKVNFSTASCHCFSVRVYFLAVKFH